MAFKTEVVGTGAVGTLIGGLLGLEGHDVSFRSEKLRPRETNGNGLRILLPDGWLSAGEQRFVGTAERTEPDAVIFALGWQYLHAMRRPDFQLIADGRRALRIFLNADPCEAHRLCGQDPPASIALTLMNAVKLQANEVELATEDPVVVFEKRAGIEKIFTALSSCGFRLLPVDELAPYSDSFLVSRVLAVPVSLCNTTLGGFLSYPEGRELASRLLEEGLLTMERAGRKLARLPLGDPRALLTAVQRKPKAFDRERGRADRRYDSVLQSFLLGKASEAPFLMRRIVDLASESGIQPTWSWRVLQKASRVTAVGFYRHPAELLESLG